MRSRRLVALLAGLLGIAALVGCGGEQNTQPPKITVSLSPSTASVVLGNTQQLSATVTGGNSSGLQWFVNGVEGGNSMLGTITSTGLYTAPTKVPTTSSITVLAAYGQNTATAALTITSDVAVSLASVPPGASYVVTGSTLQLSSTLTTMGKPDPGMTWTVNGIPNGNALVGSISTTSGGLTFTAPPIMPTPNRIMIVCTSVADPAKSATMSIAIANEFAYVTNAGSNDVSGYFVDSTTGSLRPVTIMTFPAGTAPDAAAITPDAQYLYVGNRGSGDISAFRISKEMGTLGGLLTSRFAGPPTITSMAIGHSGQFLYATNWTPGSISVYAIDSATGALAPIAGSPFTAGAYAQTVSIHPSGKFLYTTDNGYLQIQAFAIDATTGGLTPIAGSPFSVPATVNPIAATVDRLGRFLYVIDAANNLPTAPANKILVYTIDATTGALTPAVGSPFSSGTNEALGGVVPDLSGKFLYVTNYASVLSFGVTSAGMLTPLAGSPYSSTYTQLTATIDPLGKFLYVLNPYTAPAISAYRIDPSTGGLTPVPGQPFAAGTGASSIAITLAY